MAYLGASEAAFHLGNQAVSVYLGAVEVYSASATLYFNGAVDGEWTELGNWSTGSLPTAADSVIATASILTNSGSEPTVVNFTLNDPNANFLSLDILITATGMATFNGGCANGGTVTGNATFNDSSNVGTVTGNAAFNDSSANLGTVTGNATFNDSSANFGTVTGTITDNT